VVRQRLITLFVDRSVRSRNRDRGSDWFVVLFLEVCNGLG
jgi:hypothetical protein